MKTIDIDLTRDTATLPGSALALLIKEKENYLQQQISILSQQVLQTSAADFPTVLEIALGDPVDTNPTVLMLGLHARELVRMVRLLRKLRQFKTATRVWSPDGPQHVYTVTFEQLVDCELHL